MTSAATQERRAGTDAYLTHLQQEIAWARAAQAAAASRRHGSHAWTSAIKDLAAQGARPSLLAKAAGLTRARIHQILAEE